MNFLANRKATMDTFQVLALVLLFAIAFGTGAFDRFTGQAAAGVTTGVTTTITGLPECIGIDKCTVTLSAYDVYDATVGVRGNHQYKINSGRATTVANDGTFDASPGDKLQVLWGQGNNSGDVQYLNDYKEYTIPCAGTKTYSFGLQRNGTITSEIFNEEGNLIDGATENESLSTGEVVTLTHNLKGTSERGSYVHGGCAIVEYNNTAYDEVVYDLEGQSKKISNPSYFTISSTANVARTYTIPAFTSSKILRGSITINVDDAKTIAEEGTGANILIYWRPNEYRLNSITNEFQLFTCGENEDGDRVSNALGDIVDTLYVDNG